MNETEIDTTNYKLISVHGGEIVSLVMQWHMPKHEALNVAAWIVALADDAGEFDALLTAVKQS